MKKSTQKSTRTAPTAKRAPPSATAKKRVRPTPSADVPAPASEASPKVKHKLVRDSFTIPKVEYAVLEGLKLRAANLARPVKKSELLRAGIAALNGMTDKAFLTAINRVPSLKTGRPKRLTDAPLSP